MKIGRKRIRPPSHKITIYIPLQLMEVFDRFLFERNLSMTETIEFLITDLLEKEGYLTEEERHEILSFRYSFERIYSKSDTEATATAEDREDTDKDRVRARKVADYTAKQ